MSFLLSGKNKAKTDTRIGGIVPTQYPTNEAARSLPVFWGVTRLGGTFISGLFNQISQPIQESYGSGSQKKTVTTGYNYSASFALLFCSGVVETITDIQANDASIWSGSLSRSSADGNGMTPIMTPLGNIRFYWGSSIQNPDSVLGHGIAYRQTCYAVFDGFFFGTNTSPPKITITATRVTAGLSISAHQIASDGVLPEIVLDILTNPVYGAALPASNFDTTSFSAVAELIIAEGAGVSPKIERSQTVRNVLAELLPYINAGLYYQAGKIKMTVERADFPSSGFLSIDHNLMTEEPTIERGAWSETWNETRVPFVDRDRGFNDNVSSFNDPSNSDIQGMTVQKEFSRPYVTRESVAFQMAYNIGKLAGLPVSNVKLKLLSSAGDFHPGQKLQMTYEPLNISSFPLRIRRVTFGDPVRPGIDIEAIEDLTSVTAISSFTPPANPIYNPVDAAPENAFFRIAGLTSEQGADGVLVAASRPHGMITGAAVYATWSLSAAFSFLTETARYPIQTGVNRWRRYSATTLLFDVTLTNDFEAATLQAYRDAGAELYLVAGLRLQKLVISKDQHQVIPGWCLATPGGRFVTTGVNRWEIEVTPGKLGSASFGLEDFAGAVDGAWPSASAFLGRVDDFWALSTGSLKFAAAGGNDPTDIDQKRFIRILTETPRAVEDLADGATLYFDRNDTTGSTAGTFQSDWGARVTNLEYPSAVMADGPSGFWRLAETSGTTAADHTVNALAGTYAGTITLGATSALSIDPTDKAASFAGGGVAVADNALLSVTTALTVEFWIKTTTTTLSYIIAKHGEEVSGFEVFIDTSGKINFRIHHGSGAAPKYTTVTTVGAANTGAWRHIACRFTAGAMAVYIDGAADANTATAPVSTIPANTTALSIGRRETSALPITATLDEIAFYQSALTGARILAHYQSGTGALW